MNQHVEHTEKTSKETILHENFTENQVEVLRWDTEIKWFLYRHGVLQCNLDNKRQEAPIKNQVRTVW